MADEHDHIYHPKADELPVATPNVVEILFRCYEEGMSPEDALEECKCSGASTVTIADVENAYQRLCNLAQWLNERLLPYLKTTGNT